MQHVLITKADGEQEPFDPTKIERSLEHAGATSTVRARILGRILHELRPGITTEEIYRHAFEMLKGEEKTPVAARYSVKRAVFALGPSGFPFEQFLAEILRGHGWNTKTDQMLLGRCAPHEVDVLAEKGGTRVGIEVKFHNEQGGKTDIKDALYVYARYEDLKRAPLESSRVDEGWLVTNTVFTRNAIRYARCSNLTLLAWDYPHTRGLVHLIEEARVHPLTCLTTLSESEKRRLLDSKIVLCKSVQSELLLKDHGIAPGKIADVQREAQQLCGI
ncbi:restriction endonuclease [Candidatus Kaiserbacteria bacterium]|nr:restriction endonuclease [Candidatus Kaiserbacteria bacterium]